MKAILTVLLTSTAIGAAGMALADGLPNDGEAQPESFTWIDLDESGASAEKHDDAPVHPALSGYPSEDAPKLGVPKGGEPRYMNLRGDISPNAPPAMLEAAEKPSSAGDAKAPAVTGAPIMGTGKAPAPRRTDQQRRGEMVGDDGVLEAIQDQPAHLIHRRGGETPGSRAGYTHPDDIRRANTLEERRIPIHEIGRHIGKNSPLWHSDPQNPWEEPPASWQVNQGELLSTLLYRWSEMAAYTVVWETSHDYVLRANVVLKGTFPEAVGKVVQSFANANPPLHAEFFGANKVVVISTAADFDGR